jgi:hypothetical protein
MYLPFNSVPSSVLLCTLDTSSGLNLHNKESLNDNEKLYLMHALRTTSKDINKFRDWLSETKEISIHDWYF